MKTTINQILNIVDETMDAQDFSQEIKIRWISEAEASVIDRVISHFEGYRASDHKLYDENTETDTELIAPLPYARLYEYYIKAQIDYSRHELELYQNDLAQYEGALSDFFKYYNVRHKHIESRLNWW